MNMHLTLDRPYYGAFLLLAVCLPLPIPITSAAIVIFGLAWILMDNFSDKWHRLQSAWPVWLFAALYGAYLLGLLWTHDKTQGWFIMEKLLPLVVLPIIIGSSPSFTEKQCGRIELGFIFSCLAISLLSLGSDFYHLFSEPVQQANFDPVSNQSFHAFNPGIGNRWQSFSYINFGQRFDLHPTYFSMYVVQCIVLLHKSHFRMNRTWKFVLAGCFTVILILLSSRMGILVYALAVILIIFDVYISKRRPLQGILLTTLFLGFMVTATFLLPVSRYRVWQEPAQTAIALKMHPVWNSVNLRLVEWSATWDVISHNWVLGTGAGDFYDELDKAYDGTNLDMVYREFGAHNQYLQTVASTGVIGLTFLIALLAICFSQGLFRRSLTLSLFVLSFSLFCMTESTLERQKGIVYLGFFSSYFLFATPEKSIQ